MHQLSVTVRTSMIEQVVSTRLKAIQREAAMQQSAKAENAEGPLRLAAVRHRRLHDAFGSLKHNRREPKLFGRRQGQFFDVVSFHFLDTEIRVDNAVVDGTGGLVPEDGAI